ncbi:MAG: CHAT domain-containing protein [Nigerium sp.]|nr:CHAT domain-containing protein [Nigerium sp.]
MSSLVRQPLGVLTMSARADDLLGLPTWAERLAFLNRNPDLGHRAIADRCRAEGDAQLSDFIERAASVGISQATLELRSLEALERVTSVTATDGPDGAQPEHARTDELVAAAALVIDGATWLTSALLTAATAICAQNPDASPAIREIIIPPLAHSSGVTVAEVKGLLALAVLDWADVWPSLDRLAAQERLADAFPAALAAAGVSADIPQLEEWVSELCSLIDAATTRGPEAAMEEHQLLICAWAFTEDDGLDGLEESDDPATVCAQLAAEIAHLVQRVGATWLVPAAIDIGRLAVRLTPVSDQRRAGRLSNLSSAIAVGVQAGVLAQDSISEALDAAREAVRLGSPDSAVAARLAANLGNRISLAVDAEVLPVDNLREAVSLHQDAWAMTAADDPARAQRASNLGALLSDAVAAGVLPMSEFERALAFQDESVRAAEPDGPDLPTLLSNRANRIALAVQYAVLPPEALLDGVADLERAITLMGPSHPARVGVQNNLASLLSEAIHAGLLPASRIREALTLAENVLVATPPMSLDWPSYANNLAIKLGMAVAAGVVPLDRLATAVELAEQAVNATPLTHSARAGRVATLIGRTLAAIDAGVLPPDRVANVVVIAEAMWLATPATHPLRAKLAHDMATLLSEAVKHRLMQPARLLEALDLGREGLRLTSPTQVDWSESASNVAAIMSEAVSYDLLPEAALSDAVDLAEQALANVGDSPVRAGLATNASALMAEAVAAGVRPSELLSEATALQAEALDLAPFPHPDRAAYASNMVQRLADALAAGFIAPADALHRLNALVADAWEQVTTSVTPLQRERMLALTSRLATLAPLLALRLTDAPIETVRVIETLRGHLWRGRRAPRLKPGQLSPEREAQYLRAAADYELSQLHAIDGVGTHTHATTAFAALSDAMAAAEAECPGAVLKSPPSSAQLLDAAPQGVAAVYLLAGTESPLSTFPGVAIVLGHQTCTALPLPELTRSAVVEMVGSLLDPACPAENVREWLWRAVAQPLLESDAARSGPLDAPEWAFVPTGLMGMLPLHAAGNATRTLEDEVGVVTIRSVLPVTPASPGTPSAKQHAVAMALPATDLAYPSADLAVATTLLADCHRLPADTEPAILLDALAEASTVVLSGHGLHALDVGGSLRLGPAEADLWLTAEDVARLPIRRRDLALLAACSSGQPALSLPDESVGLPTALLSIGFTSVVATLWPVGDAVAFVTMARLLELRATDPAMPAAEALRRTRGWVRRATCAQLNAWLDGLLVAVPFDTVVAARLRAEWAAYPDLIEPMPYADARDWAAFACVTAVVPRPRRA